MAQQLIDSLSGEFEPEKYRDEYREQVLEMIERKAQGEEIVVEAPPEEPKKVPDLMAALEASIKASKRQGGARAKRSADGGDGAKPKTRSRSGSSKRKTAKKS
jgi:DNA end-binding protein Ku